MKKLIYYKSPYFVKCIMASIKGFLNRRERYNQFYHDLYKTLVVNYNSDYQSIKNYQRSELIKLLEECFTFSKYYRKIFQEKNIEIENIKNDPYKVLFSLPILSKEVRKSEVDSIVNLNPSRKTLNIGYTSGTTGTPTKTYTDKYTNAMSFALWHRFHYSIDLEKSEKHIRFSGNIISDPKRTNPPFWVFNKADNQLLMSVYNLSEENLIHYVNKIIKFKPIYIDGFPSSISIIAEYINKNNVKLPFTLKAVCTTAETLFDYQRKQIETAFQCKVFNQYASSEGSPFITECSMGKMHIEEDSGVFEFLDDNNQPIENGQVGRMVVTSLRNWKTPLLRYDILDYAELNESTDACPCGSPFKYVKAVHGRANDMLWTKERGYISGGIASSLKNFSGIKQVQMIQKRPDLLQVNIVKNDQYNIKDENKISRNLKERIGQGISIQFTYVEFIEHNVSGKLKLLIRDFNVEDYK